MFKTLLNDSDIPLDVLLDTGSNRSYINATTAVELNFKIYNIKPFGVTFGNGTTFNVSKQTKIKFKPVNSQREFDVRCNVVEDLTKRIILGNDFLERNNSIINFRDKVVTTDAGIITLNNTSNKNYYDPDEEILKFTKAMIKKSESKKEEISNSGAKYKDNFRKINIRLLIFYRFEIKRGS